MINDKLTSSLAEAYKKMKQEELKGDQHKIDANKNGEIDAHDFKLLRAKNEEKEGWDSKKHAVSEQEEPRRIPEKDKKEPLMPKKPATLGGELAMKAVQRIISKHKTNEENEPRRIPEKDKNQTLVSKNPSTLGAELAMKDVEKMVAKNKTANEEPVNELGPETLISYAMKAKGQERPGIVNPRRDAMVDLAVKKASASAKPINNSYVPEEKEDAPFAGPYVATPKKQKGQKSDPSMSRARDLARKAMQNLAQKKKDQKVAEEFVLEGKMGQLHADIGDHLDKHIKDYNAGNLGHDSFGEKVVAAHKKIAELHGISPNAAKNHVNDYVDQHMKEEVKEPTGDLKDACWKGYTAVGLKKKGGRMVPNCVPKNEEVENIDERNMENKKKKNEYVASIIQKKLHPSVLPSLAYGRRELKKEEVELNEGNDDVGEMIKDKLKIIINRAKEMHDGIGPNTDMPEWVKSKITLAQDYVSTACDYSCGSEQLGEELELNEISKSTLGSYIKKASHDVATKSALTRAFKDKSEKEKEKENFVQARKDDEKSNRMFDKSWKRRQGIAKAADRLAKEEFTQIDEVGYQPATGDAAASSAGGRVRPVTTIDTSSSPKPDHPGTAADKIQAQNIAKAREPEAYARAEKAMNRPLTPRDIGNTPEGRAGGRGSADVVRAGKEMQADIKKLNQEEFEITEDMETPDIKVRKTYTDAYADHYKRALKLNPKGASKRAEAMAYDTVKMKHGDDAHDALKAYHEKNQNESYEQIDEELSSRAKLVKELYNKAKEAKKSKKDSFDPEPEMEIMPSPRYSQPKR